MKYVESRKIERRSGEVSATMVPLAELANGVSVHVPVITACGSSDGPTIVVHGGMHGDEILGMACVRLAMDQVDVSKVTGTIIAVPVANMPGMALRTRRNMLELYPGPHDMNRIYPGSSNGNFTERVADFMLSEVLSGSDYLLDMHNASVGGWWEPYATFDSGSPDFAEGVAEKSEAIARAFGTELVISGNRYHGSLVDQALLLGIPAAMVEFGVANVIKDEEVAFGAAGIHNVLAAMGVLTPEGGRTPARDDQVHLTRLDRVLSNHGGFLRLLVGPGDMVQEGQAVAEITDLAGEVVDLATAPTSGRVCRITTMGVIATGDILLYVGS